MSYRISDFMTSVNAALNYPAISYDDVAVYLDMCVAEINTTLHTSLRSIRECVEYEKTAALAENEIITFSSAPSGDSAQIRCVSSVSGLSDGWYLWVGASERPEWYRRFVHVTGGAVDKVRDKIFGVYVEDGVAQTFEAYAYSDALCLWISAASSSDVDLLNYLPEDWISLFMIPYVCFKYTCRDGGIASTFAEEMEQGFQQLQETYDVPSSVYLPRVADRRAYRQDVQEMFSAGGRGLDVMCKTRAIYEEMKHPRGVTPTYSNSRGGWGL